MCARLVDGSDDIHSLSQPQGSRWNWDSQQTLQHIANLISVMSMQERGDEHELDQSQLCPNRRVAAQAVLTAAFALHSLPSFAVEVCTIRKTTSSGIDESIM